MLSEIEWLDVREGDRWELLKPQLGGDLLTGHSLGCLQISASEILIFGSYFKCNEDSCFGQRLYFSFDHDRKAVDRLGDNTIIKSMELDENLESLPPLLEDGSYGGDTFATNRGVIYAFN